MIYVLLPFFVLFCFYKTIDIRLGKSKQLVISYNTFQLHVGLMILVDARTLIKC
jgi:hypothetical protein